MAETVENVRLEQTANGSVSFATDVVATIAGLAAAEVEGVASMVAPNGGFAEKLTRRMTGTQNKNFTKGVKVEMNGSDVTVDISFIVEYGQPIPQVASEMQENVKKAIETMTGLNVTKIDIHVTGISFDKENREAQALEGAEPEETPEIEDAASEDDVIEDAEEEPEVDTVDVEVFDDDVDLEEPADAETEIPEETDPEQ